MDASEAREAVIAAGRRAGDGFVRLAIFTPELLELTVEAHGERASTLLLTRDQIAELQQTLSLLGIHISGDIHESRSGADATEQVQTQPWDGKERRR